jgi:hypothetical protein
MRSVSGQREVAEIRLMEGVRYERILLECCVARLWSEALVFSTGGD